MNLKRTFLTIVGAIVLTTGMSGGIAVAQDNPSSSTGGLTFTQQCLGTGGTGNTNVPPSAVSLSANGDVNFGTFDPANPGDGTLSTANKAIRLNISINNCLTGAWHVDASITNFEEAESDAFISGTQFQLPIGAATSSMTATRADSTAVTNVVAPGEGTTVAFAGATAPYAGSTWIARATGTAQGEMSLDYTGRLTGLGETTVDGVYTAQLTVSFTPSAP